MKQYNYNNKIYTVTNCTLEDIPSHIERVLSYWKSTNTDINQQIELLQNAVKSNTAFKVIDDFLADHNYKSYYKRTWNTDDKTTCVDVGSWSERFIIQEI